MFGSNAHALGVCVGAGDLHAGARIERKRFTTPTTVIKERSAGDVDMLFEQVQADHFPKVFVVMKAVSGWVDLVRKVSRRARSGRLGAFFRIHGEHGKVSTHRFSTENSFAWLGGELLKDSRDVEV